MKKTFLLIISCFFVLVAGAQETADEQDLLRKAQKGDVEAQSVLGRYYFMNEQYKDAVYWIEKAAEAGDAQALFYLGVAYDQGVGVEEDLKKAFGYYSQATKQNHSGALYMLGLSYNYGRFVNEDLKKARKYYQKSADLGDMYAQYKYGAFCLAGAGGKIDKDAGVENIVKSAQQGCLPAVYIFADMMIEGSFVEQDVEKGMILLEASAKDGYVDSQIELGEMYFFGRYIPQNYAISAMWYEMALKNESNESVASCKNNLAYCYAYGAENLPQDFEKAHLLIDEAISEVPDEASFYDSKGEFYLMQGDKENARKMWDKVVELNPDFKHTTLYKGLFENQEGK